MALYVQTNVSSLNTQRQLTNATNSLSTTYQRLSSGYRINSAKDDAAGLQIANRMTNQINGLNQANRNANDGIALAQTVEGAMDEMTSMYQSIRTLAVQSASGTYTSTDREAMNQDATSYSTEITRISEKTTYNGQTVLTGKDAADGSLLDAQGMISIQAGAYSNDYVSVDLSDGFSVLQTAKAALANYYDEMGLANGDCYEATADAAGNSTGIEVATLSASTFVSMFGSTLLDEESWGVATDDEGNVYITEEAAAELNDGLGYSEKLAQETNSAGSISSTVSEAENVTLDALGEVVLDEDGTVSGAVALSLNDMYSLINGVAVTTDGDNDNSNNLLLGALMGIQISASTRDLSGSDTDYGNSALNGAVATIDVTTVANAQAAIDWSDNFLSVVDSKRAELGALQNRLESTISNQSNIAENVSDARSRIQDADYAEETANLSQQTIIQQAATSMLTQANATTQLALTLLG